MQGIQQVLFQCRCLSLPSTRLVLGAQAQRLQICFSSLPRQDWDTVERQEEAPSWDELTMMIPRKPQEGPRADSARRVPCPVTRAPAGGDTAGQRKEGESFQARLVPVTTGVVMA